MTPSNLLLNLTNLEERRIAHHKTDDYIVSTVAIYGEAWKYETGISHPEYRDGDWIIVETYQTRLKALYGHAKWMLTMEGELPNELLDVVMVAYTEKTLEEVARTGFALFKRRVVEYRVYVRTKDSYIYRGYGSFKRYPTYLIGRINWIPYHPSFESGEVYVTDLGGYVKYIGEDFTLYYTGDWVKIYNIKYLGGEENLNVVLPKE